MNEGAAYFLPGDRVTQVQAGNQLQNTFVAACGQGNVEQMTRLLGQGVAIDEPDAAGQYPLIACLESCKMPAIKFLSARVEEDGGQAWQRIELDNLKAQLSGRRVAPLPANVTYGQLADRFQADRARLEELYDARNGNGQYHAHSMQVRKSVDLLMVTGTGLLIRASRFEAAVAEANRGIEAVLAYARAALERLIAPSPAGGF